MSTVRLPVVQGARGSILSDGHRKTIIPADVRGPYAVARKSLFAVLIGAWVALPWVRVHGAPAVFLDEEARRFYLFGATFNAQDTWLLFFLLSGVGFGLVYVTALAGRVWCGWACPQTVFLEGVYRPVERWIEGGRERQLRRDLGPWSFGRAARKLAKHLAFAVLSLVLAHVVLAYFVSLPRAFAMVRQAPSAHLEAFVWVMSITAVVYGNFAWFREQLCVVLCPYGRLQSVMLDEDSLVVGYDVGRGEPRGKKGKADGDCVDCKRCVVVCPTGIDIRDGLQLDCIACTACIDACNEVMGRMGRPRGLVRYDSPNGLGGSTRRIVRPRLALYTALLLVGGVVAVLATHARTDFETTASRLPGPPYTLDGASIRNAFDLHLVNKRGDDATFAIRIEAPTTIEAIVPVTRITVEPLRDAHVPFFLSMRQSDFHSDTRVRVRVVREGTGAHDTPEDAMNVSVTFLGVAR